MTLTDVGMALAIIGFVALLISMVCASLQIYLCEHAGWVGILALALAAWIFAAKIIGFI